jgi:5'-deoxynucleotidase YfbR-like HD superfamily hydrolase
MVSESPRVIRTQDTFIRTFTGKRFWPLDPKPEEVDIEDIAHALSLVCRFTGHTYCFYSVADHSLRVSKLAEQLTMAEHGALSLRVKAAREMALWGLLHDASEAYLCDVPSPLKRAPGLGQLYKGFERKLMEVIADRFNLSPHEPAVVKDADRILLKTEMRDLMNATEGFSLDWDYAGYSPLPETIFPLDPQHAEVEFLRRFNALNTARLAERLAETPSPRKAS